MLDLIAYFAFEGSQPFKDRRATMPQRGAVPVAKEPLSQTWQEVVSQPTPPRKQLVYLHIPFCATHCTFCGSYQSRFGEDNYVRYTNALLREIEMEVDSTLYQSAPIHVVYFDDGMPSVLSAQGLTRIITALRDELPLVPGCGITIEGRVLNFDDMRIDTCLDTGASRPSIDIRSFNSRIRKKMACTSDGPTATAFIQGLVERDRAVMVCDSLFGLPGQDIRLWGGDLATARDIDLDGADLYALNLIPDMPLGETVEAERTTVPSPTERHDLYLQGCDFIGSVGQCCVSNDHWARATQERSLYNLLIKQGADCLVLGSGTGGLVNGYSWMVERNSNTWHESIVAGKKLLMMITRTAERGFQWQHTLQAGVETVRVPPDELTSHAQKLAPLLTQ